MVTRRTAKDAEGRLFPHEEFPNGWTLSLQADDLGYACSPKERLDVLEGYATVEARITGPFPHEVDPRTIGLPDEVADKFTDLYASGVSLGLDLTWEDVEILRKAILMTGMNPNAGIPKGIVGWSGRKVWHGASQADAEAIMQDGVDVSRSTGGYFGHAFYVADQEDLARSNYADFADDEGAVLEFFIEDGARILDMRNPEDAEAWSKSGLSEWMGNPLLPQKAKKLGIQGVYDRSVGGLAIFDVDALSRPLDLLPARDAGAMKR